MKHLVRILIAVAFQAAVTIALPAWPDNPFARPLIGFAAYIAMLSYLKHES